jgi:phosphomannomutase
MAHTFHPTLLREYDIRGIVDDTLHEADAKAIGQAFGTVVKRDGGAHVIVGWDGRVSSPAMAKALTDDLVSCGIKVTQIGLGPTPMLYFATKHLGADAGVMITGSHNPPDYNGFKMLTKSGPFYGQMIQEIGTIAAGGAFAQGSGSVETLDVREIYVERLLKDFHGARPLTIAWDCGNGATGEIARRLTAKLPGKHILLFDEIDGRFPNHHPDPTVPKNMVDLQKAVAQHGCDLGIAFDGDGDRIGAVDEDGTLIFGDQLVAIYAEEVLAERPGATIIADVKASQTLFDRIKTLGGTPLMWKTGHSLIKAKMAEVKSPLAGEMSGHIFFADKYYGFDDALYCGVRLAGLVSRSAEKLSALRKKLPSVFNTPEIRFQTDETRKFAVVDEVKARLKSSLGADSSVNDIDGVRVSTPDGWWLLRASNTQDVLVARAEAFSEAGLARLKNLLADQLKASGLNPPKDF